MFENSGITESPNNYFHFLNNFLLTITEDDDNIKDESHLETWTTSENKKFTIFGNTDKLDRNEINLKVPNDCQTTLTTNINDGVLTVGLTQPSIKYGNQFISNDVSMKNTTQRKKKYCSDLTLKVPLGNGTNDTTTFKFFIQYCLHKNTIIRTDQGDIEIQYLTKSNTISNKAILGISKTINSEKKMILIKKNSLGENLPSKDTICSHNHSILYAGKMRNSQDLLHINGVSEILDDSDFIYNVLTEKHSIMCANNLPVETLDPESELAKFYLEVWNMDLDTETKNEITNILFKN